MKTVLLHGLGQSPVSWEATSQAMGPDSNIVCPDLSKWIHQAAPSYPAVYQAFEAYAEQLEAPFCLGGLSLGGMLALHYAIEHGEKLQALALIGTQASTPKTMLKFQNLIFRMLPDSSFRGMGLSKDEAIQLCQSMAHLDFRPKLDQIRCRTLILCGENDAANQSAARKLRRGIPGADFSLIPRAGHEVNLDNPFELGTALRGFFHG